MSLYKQIKDLIDAGKTDAEIAATPIVTRTPFMLTFNQCNLILSPTQAQEVAAGIATASASSPWWAMVRDTLCNNGVDTSLDATQGLIEYAVAQGIISFDVGAILKATGVQISYYGSESEIAAARAEGLWLAQRATVEAAIDAKYSGLLEAYNAAKSTLGGLNVGDEIPSAETLWA